jgi:hypothetical protein
MQTATPKKASIPEHIRMILSDMERDGHVMKPYPKQLERKVYEELNKVLTALGGKWKSKVGHVFACSATELESKLEAAIESGEYTCPRANDYFPTPDDLADRLVAKADVQPHHMVLEPSAGKGALLDAVRRKFGNAKLEHYWAIELLTENRKDLTDKGYTVFATDFDAIIAGEHFDRIIMNPPFARGMAHILKAYSLLKEGGRLVAIAPAGVLFRRDKDYELVRHLAEETGWIEELPEDSFKASGTSVRTVMLCIEK